MQSGSHLHHKPPTGWTLSTALTLGRVSNLPTVWTNTLAGILMAGGSVLSQQTLPLIIAMSLAYIGGMFLNDAFDRHIDAIQRPERPIPAGLVSPRDVFIAGFGMLLLAILLVHLGSSGNGSATIAATLLTALIVLYNCWHKANPVSPLIMGLCRLMVYISCALAISSQINTLLLMGSAVTLSYLIGLTYTAKQEQFGHISCFWPLAFLAAPIVFGAYIALLYPLIWIVVAAISLWIFHCLRLILRRQPGDMPRAVVRLIAGISLIDLLLMLSAINLLSHSGPTELFSGLIAAIGLAAFSCTLLMQRFIAGT